MRPDVEQDLTSLLEWLHSAALHLLAKNGEFYPIGALVRSGGEMTPFAAETESEEPSSIEVIDALAEVARAEGPAIRAFAVCYEGEVSLGEPAPRRALIVELEHRENQPMKAIAPFADGKSLKTDDFIFARGTSRVFAA